MRFALRLQEQISSPDSPRLLRSPVLYWEIETEDDNG